jgi:hypothetical protein
LIELQMEQDVEPFNRCTVESAKPSDGEAGLAIRRFNHSTIHASVCPPAANRQ